MKTAYRVAVFVLMPVLGYLIVASAWHIFGGMYGAEKPDGPTLDSRTYAVATSCDRQGPVSLHGFGYWWECQTEVHWQGNGNMFDHRTVTFLTPEDIGKQVRVTGVRNNRGIERAAERPYQWVAVVLGVPFAIFWLRLMAKMSRYGAAHRRLNPAVERVLNRIEAERTRPPGTSVVAVRRGQLAGLKVGLVVLLLGWVAAFGIAEGMAGPPVLLVVGGVSLVACLGLVMAWVRTWVSVAGLTIAPEGILWAHNRKSGLVAWDELWEVRVSPSPTSSAGLEYVITVDPLNEDARTLPGEYTSSSVTEIEQAMLRFSPDSVGWRRAASSGS